MNEIEKKIRAEFPLLMNDGIRYLDNAATTQKPQCVLDAMNEYYQKNNANPMRGLYDLSLRATEAYEEAREAVAKLINAPRKEDIVFTRNATESLNLIAYSYVLNFLHEGDEIIVSIVEHHSNFLPWLEMGKKVGAKVVFFEAEPDGELKAEKLEKLCTPKTKLIAVTHVSNVLGRESDIRTFSEIAHKHGAILVADGAQSVPHMKVDVQELGCDFLTFSGHKIYGPMGIGGLYGKRELLKKMPPFMFGGEMIEYVTREGATYAEVPHKFEAGTVNAGGAVGFKAAIDFVNRWGWNFIEKRENDLTEMMMDGMKKIPHVHILGSEKPEEHHGIVTFLVDDVHPHDIAEIFDSENIGVRAGHHCAQPLMQFLGVNSTTRASLAFYNTEEEVQAFLDCLATIREKMGYGA
ncbi:MAG: cysteine desulfurase [Eubacteriales bacterium]|nr:cysteine desulfurase [Eubacteriales bacterium]